MDDLVGKKLGNFEIRSLISDKGGFGIVYLAWDTLLHRPVALKALRAERVASYGEAFLEEAQKCASLDHPHIVPVFDFKASPDMPPYLVMKYAAKGTLRERHHSGSRVPLPDIVRYVQQVADALQYIHMRQPPLIHRDVKPANMLVGERGEIMLSDFGIAVKAQIGGQTSRSIEGTPLYASPEQFQGRSSPASDQYSLAVVVYEWLCGRLPFTSSEPDGNKWVLQLARLHVSAPPPPLREKGVAECIEQVVFKALAKNAADRYPTIQDFAEALAAAAQQAEIEEKTQPRPVPPPSSEKLPRSFPSTQYDIVPPTEPVGSLPFPSTIIPFRIYSDYSGEITCLVPSPDGRYIASASTDNAVYIWEVASRLTLCAFCQHQDRVIALAWSPDGERIASLGRDNMVLAWDALTGTKVACCDGYPGVATAITWQSKGLRIAVITDCAIEIWTVATRKIAAPPYTGHARPPQIVAWSPDGRAIASADSSAVIHLWDMANSLDLTSLSGPEGGIAALVWSPQGERIAAACSDKTVRIWDTRSGQLVCVNRDHALWAAALAWSPEGSRLASAGRDGAALVWDVRTGQDTCTYLAHSGEITALAWSRYQDSLVSVGKDDGVHVWDAPMSANLLTFRQHSAAVSALAWSPHGDRIISGDMAGSVLTWYANNGQSLAAYNGHARSISALAWSPDERCIASVSHDGALHLWNTSTQRREYQGTSSARKVTALAWSPEGQYLGIGGQDGSVQLLSKSNKKMIDIRERHDGPVVSLSWAVYGLVMTSLSFSKSIVWDGSHRKVTVSELHLPQFSNAAHIAFSPDELFLAYSYNIGAITVWNRVTGLRLVEFGDQGANLLAWSSDSRYLAAASRGTVQVWSASMRSVILHHHLHEGEMRALAWSPDSAFIASAGDDQTVRVIRLP
ncbi:MAG: WD40 repeat domain-containing serine/threonine-protein kinase [Ktedonobacteraceae bacterium]